MWHLPKLSPVKDMLELFPFITSSLRISILLRTEEASFDVFTKSKKSMNCKIIFERYVPVYYKFWLEILITHLAIDLKLWIHTSVFTVVHDCELFFDKTLSTTLKKSFEKHRWHIKYWITFYLRFHIVI